MIIIRRFIALLTSFLMTVFGVSGVTLQQRADNLRVTAYIVADNAAMMKAVDESHLPALTDIILIGSLARFDKDGNVRLCADFGQIVAAAREKIGALPIRLHLNVLGPGWLTGETFEEQMYSQGEEHKKAFASGVLENNLLDVLEEYGLDGVFFDYEFPVAQEHKEAFGAFLVSLKRTLGDAYVLGAAESSWCAGLPKAAIRALDMVEVMCYDLWDADGKHASMNVMKDVMKQMRKHGYKRAQLDAGRESLMRDAVQDGVFRAKKLKKALEAGDAVAMEAVDRACHWLAIATGSMINTLNPELILYGGGVIEAMGETFLQKILSEVDRYCMPQIRKTTEIKNAALGDDSILYGGLAMIKGL